MHPTITVDSAGVMGFLVSLTFWWWSLNAFPGQIFSTCSIKLSLAVPRRPRPLMFPCGCVRRRQRGARWGQGGVGGEGRGGRKGCRETGLHTGHLASECSLAWSMGRSLSSGGETGCAIWHPPVQQTSGVLHIFTASQHTVTHKSSLLCEDESILGESARTQQKFSHWFLTDWIFLSFSSIFTIIRLGNKLLPEILELFGG